MKIARYFTLTLILFVTLASMPNGFVLETTAQVISIPNLIVKAEICKVLNKPSDTEETQLDPPETVLPPLINLPSQSIVFSEFMFESEGGLRSKPQWIEVHNTTDNSVNLKDYSLYFKRLVPNVIEVRVSIQADFIIPARQSRLIVSTGSVHRSDYTTLDHESVYNLFNFHSTELDQNDGKNRNRIINTGGFYISLLNPDESVIDAFGTIKTDWNSLLWELPDGIVGRSRTSMVRRFDSKVPRSGLEESGWIKASDANNITKGYYYGSINDIGTPTYRKGRPPELVSYPKRVDRLTDAANDRYKTRLDSLKKLLAKRQKEWPKRSLAYNLAKGVYKKDLEILKRMRQNELHWASKGQPPSTTLTKYEQYLLNLIDE